jgi:hypothetical protein
VSQFGTVDPKWDNARARHLVPMRAGVGSVCSGTHLATGLHARGQANCSYHPPLPPIMWLRRRASLLSLLVALGVMAACTDAPTAASLEPTTRRASRTSSLSLEALLVAEKERIAQRQQAEQAVYDSLKPLWQAVLDDTTGRYDDSLMCDPKQYVGEAKIVGPAGDDVNFGEHTLRIPAGALSAPTVITAEAPTSLRVLAVFSPHGTRFNPAYRPTLELSYKHCRGPLNREARIAYISATGQILEWPPSQDFPELGLVRGLLDHFSNYIIAY